MNTAETLFQEIEHILSTHTALPERYYLLERLLDRVVKERTQDFSADFTHLSSRLHTLCRVAGCNPYPIELFRANARRVRQGTYHPKETDFRYDLKALCEAVATFYKATIPATLKRLLPARWRAWQHPAFAPDAVPRIRLTVTSWDETMLYGYDAEQPTEQPLCVRYTTPEAPTPFAVLHEQLYPHAQVNLLNVRSVEGTLVPEAIVLDPDFLTDITTICGLLRPSGHTPLAHLLHKFMPAPTSEAISLGNLANQFLDDCVNEREADAALSDDEAYRRSMQRGFQNAPMELATLPEIGPAFFDNARQQFVHIRRTVHEQFSAADIDIRRADVQLEPSFLCEALGLQGRLDVLVNPASKIIELKSGKADEFPTRHPRHEHALQMALYKEMLHHCLGARRSEMQTFLFYSRYPLFYNISAPRAALHEALALRNGLVTLERRLRTAEGARTLLHSLTEADFNTAGLCNSFYERYIRPSIIHFLHTLHGMDSLTEKYFCTFLAFLEREQLLAKTGDGRPDSGRGFADTWNADAQTRRADGNLLTDLTLHPIEGMNGAITHLEMELPPADDELLPNFRPGDSVLLYERNSEADRATTRQIFRCAIEEMTPETLLLKLSFPQRNARVFSLTSRYAVEPAYSDGTFTQAYRGLFALLQAPPERRALLMDLRPPTFSPHIKLNRLTGRADIDHIVRRAKQADDYFLLVGPPGTGKTSVALRAMVEEFLSDTPPCRLLVMAYTNRAVDEICEMLEHITPAPDYLRIGQELCCEPRFRPHLLHHTVAKARNRAELKAALLPCRVVVGTLASIASEPSLFRLMRFDVALIDEASQVLEPQLLPLLCATTPLPATHGEPDACAIRRFILIGDHKQLPAVVLQSPILSAVTDEALHAIGLTNCRNSLFERLHTLELRRGCTDFVAMLHRQGRMHPALSEFVNQRYYGGQLAPVPVPHQEADAPPFARLPLTASDQWLRYVACTRLGFLHTDAPQVVENNKANRAEARTVAAVVKAVGQLCERAGEPFRAASRIGIIVPFRGQIACIRRALAEAAVPEADAITIDTVERYQGSQRDIILFSATVSQPYQLDILSTPVDTEGQQVDRKLNVALTRAREQFFLVGNGELLAKSPAYAELLTYISRSAGGAHIALEGGNK